MIKYILVEDMEKLKTDGTRTVMLLNEMDLKFWQDKHLVYVAVKIERRGGTMAKKEILCKDCHEDLEAIANRHNDEGFRSIKGKALAVFRCDNCDQQLPVDSIVYADTLWLPKSQSSEEGWEKDYVEASQ